MMIRRLRFVDADAPFVLLLPRGGLDAIGGEGAKDGDFALGIATLAPEEHCFVL